MNKNTIIRLHMPKSLLESLTKQVLAEAKKGDMSGGAYTEAVKMPKANQGGKKDMTEVEHDSEKAPKKAKPKQHSLEELMKVKEKIEKKIMEMESSSKKAGNSKYMK